MKRTHLFAFPSFLGGDQHRSTFDRIHGHLEPTEFSQLLGPANQTRHSRFMFYVLVGEKGAGIGTGKSNDVLV